MAVPVVAHRESASTAVAEISCRPNELQEICLKEEPYSWVLKSSRSKSSNHLESRCSACGKTAKPTCRKCKINRYCNTNCRKKDAAAHALECKAFVQLDDVEYLRNRHARYHYDARLVGRILARFEQDQGYFEGDYWFGYKSRCLDDLMSHTEELRASEDDYDEFLSILKSYRKIFDKIEPLCNASDERIFEIYGKIITNAFSVCTYNLENGTESIGTGLYLNCSRFDHSCKPDLVYNFEGPLMSMNSFSPMDKNSTLFTKYVGSGIRNFGCAFTCERRQKLLDSYWFECMCAYCADEKRDIVMQYSLAANCPYCDRDDLVLLDSGDGIKCLNCEKIVNNDKVKVMLLLNLVKSFEGIADTTSDPPKQNEDEENGEAQDDMDQSKSDREIKIDATTRWRLKAVVKGEETLSLGRDVFHPLKNVYMLRLCEGLTDNYRYIADTFRHASRQTNTSDQSNEYKARFKSAAKKAIQYGKKCLESYKIYLSPYSMWISSQQYIIAKLYFSLHHYSRGVKHLKLARVIWVRHVGNGHECVKELDDIIAENQKKINQKTEE